MSRSQTKAHTGLNNTLQCPCWELQSSRRCRCPSLSSVRRQTLWWACSKSLKYYFADFDSLKILTRFWSSHWPARASFSCDFWCLQPVWGGGESPVPRVWEGPHCHVWVCWFHFAGAARSSPDTKPRSVPTGWRWRSCWRSERFRMDSGCAVGPSLVCSALCPAEWETHWWAAAATSAGIYVLYVTVPLSYWSWF